MEKIDVEAIRQRCRDAQSLFTKPVEKSKRVSSDDIAVMVANAYLTFIPTLLDAYEAQQAEIERLTAAHNALNTFENSQLEKAIAKQQAAEAERDVAVADLNELRKRSGWKCNACYYSVYHTTSRDRCVWCGDNNHNNWKWRGLEGQDAK